jgi:mannose-6-phosphate isomerase-like protein (cupin superfamily)
MEKVNVQEKFDGMSDYWNPRIVGELNGQHVKAVKVKGDFIWHLHENEDELFYVVKGVLTLEFRTKVVILNEGEFMIVPRGVEHRPCTSEEAQILLFEPASTLNTGNITNERTRSNLEKL